MTLRAAQGVLTVAAFCSILALRIGPARAIALFFALLALVGLAIGGFLAFMYFWWPDSNGDNWFTNRRR